LKKKLKKISAPTVWQNATIHYKKFAVPGRPGQKKGGNIKGGISS